MTAVVLERPLLRRYPDARRAKFPILDPTILPYLALMFGSAIAGIAGIVNAVALRRYWLAALTLLLGAAGWLGFPFLIFAMRRAGVENVAVLLTIGRLWHMFLGGVLFFMHRPHERGHEFLWGRSIPIFQSYIAAFAVSLILPGKVTLFLLGVPLVR